MIADRVLNVINADVVSENCTGIVIQRFNRSPCKTEKCGIGQGFPHVTGIPDFIGIAFAVKSCL